MDTGSPETAVSLEIVRPVVLARREVVKTLLQDGWEELHQEMAVKFVMNEPSSGGFIAQRACRRKRRMVVRGQRPTRRLKWDFRT